MTVQAGSPTPRPIQEQRAPNATAGFDVERVRQHFPILNEKVHSKPLVYLDNAATSQKPQAVIDAMSRFFLKQNANVHRGVHYLSERATEEYEGARVKVQRFVNARDPSEIIFVRGTTEAINPGRADLRQEAPPWRRGARHHDGAPLEHRAVADALRTDRRPTTRGADEQRRRDPARRARGALVAGLGKVREVFQ